MLLRLFRELLSKMNPLSLDKKSSCPYLHKTIIKLEIFSCGFELDENIPAFSIKMCSSTPHFESGLELLSPNSQNAFVLVFIEYSSYRGAFSWIANFATCQCWISRMIQERGNADNVIRTIFLFLIVFSKTA